MIEDLGPPPAFSIVLPTDSLSFKTETLLLKQVLSNLIGNAIKYHDRPDGRITIMVRSEGNMVEFSIADDGPGISPDYHDKIFGVFQTVEARDQVESTGIGLSIVKKVVESQGGQVWVRSALGQGATFTFTWPI